MPLDNLPAPPRDLPNNADCEFTVSLRFPKDGDAGWMIATTTWRKRPGENHNRGNDQGDGPLTAETLGRVIGSLIGVVAGTKT